MLICDKIIGSIAYMGGVPVVPERFCWSWSQMIQYNHQFLLATGEDIHYLKSGLSYHSAARNYLAEWFKGDWLIMFDTDHTFEPDIAARLVYIAETYEVDVLTGVYQFRGPPYSPVLFVLNENKTAFNAIGNWDPKMNLVQVDSAGAGCLFIRRSVFDKIKETGEKPFDIRHPYSEDHSFFLRLKDLGIKSFAALNVHANHLNFEEITMDKFNRDDVDMSPAIPAEGRI